MDREQVATALCQIPEYLHKHPDSSLSARLQEILAARMEPVREADLVATLSMNSELIDSWSAYVCDQRTSDGWYVKVSTEPSLRPGWILTRPGHKDRVIFDTPVAAYAALILRIVAQALLAAGSHYR